MATVLKHAQDASGPKPPHAHGPYRPDIDGLRAIAVVSVVLFHLGVSTISGGFAGVDVFFVISGYLITGGIQRDLALGRFSILGFYERRIRRIYPALFCAIAVTLVAAAVIMMPDELRDVGSEVVATVAFASNILFWLQTDYFAGPAEFKPLLHTWSLAVEEQFYVVIPALMWVLHRYLPKHRNLTLAGLTLASFAMSCAWVWIDPSGNYFLPHTRAWELLIGSLTALGLFPRVGARLSEFAAAAALALILVPMFLLNSDSAFPAWNALPVCVGTAALIQIGEHHSTSVTKLLGIRPFVWIGLISYSLYLVHWPIIVFVRYQLLGDPSVPQTLAMCVAIFVAAWLSWRFVEQPVRRHKTPRLRLFVIAGSGSALLGLLGLVCFVTDGVPQRFGAQQQIAMRDRAQENGTGCFLKGSWDKWAGDSCFMTKNPGPTIMLWGDSHANHYAGPIQEDAAHYHSSILLYASAGCPPILGVDIPKRPNCRANNDHALDVLKTYKIQRVVLSAYWQRIFEENDLSPLDLAASVRKLQGMGIDVRVIGDNPDFPFANPTYLAVRLAKRDDPNAPYYTGVRNDFAFNQRLAQAIGPKIFYDPLPRLCRDKTCLAYENGQLLMTDNAHLSTYGAKRMLKDLDGFFQ